MSNSEYLGYPNDYAAEPMPTDEMVRLCKQHTIYTWSATGAVDPLPIARRGSPLGIERATRGAARGRADRATTV
jgi:hypothetical protein